MTAPRSRITTLALTAVLFAAACSSTSEGAVDLMVTPTVEATTPAAEPTTGASDVEDAGVVDEPAKVPVGVGETVPADQIETARAEGASVYVSPNGNGDGIVIEPGITPDVVIDDVSQVDGAAPQTMAEFGESGISEVALAAQAADTGFFVLMEAPSYGPDGTLTATRYVVGAAGVIEGFPEGASHIRSTREEAIAAIQSVMAANPGYVFIDLLG